MNNSRTNFSNQNNQINHNFQAPNRLNDHYTTHQINIANHVNPPNQNHHQPLDNIRTALIRADLTQNYNILPPINLPINRPINPPTNLPITSPITPTVNSRINQLTNRLRNSNIPSAIPSATPSTIPSTVPSATPSAITSPSYAEILTRNIDRQTTTNF